MRRLFLVLTFLGCGDSTSVGDPAPDIGDPAPDIGDVDALFDVVFDAQVDAGDAQPDAVIRIRPLECGADLNGSIGPEGGRLQITDGVHIDAAIDVPPGAFAELKTLHLGCVNIDSMISPDYLPLGQPLAITTESPFILNSPVRITLVFDPTELSAAVQPNHVRLFWTPIRYPGPLAPPMLNPEFDLAAGTVSFDTPGLGTFQLGARLDAGEPYTQRVAWRAIIGVSMGGGAASYLTTKYPDLFDFAAPLGGPSDWPFMQRHIGQRLLGGFCHADEGEGLGSWCGLPAPTEQYALPGSYRDWPYSNNGGSFDRTEYIKIFSDMAYAHGNPLLYNPESPYRAPGISADDLLASNEARCGPDAVHTILQNFYDDEYNPDGAFSVISFCDGEDGEPLGMLTPGQPRRHPIDILLAVDINNNGRRDDGEPVIRNISEPYQDVGCDGLPSAQEPDFDPTAWPDPTGDDYDWYRNPTGTENNGLWDPCEPYQDVGLDGVAGTPQFEMGGYDFGEGNGQFDYNPNTARAIDRSPGTLLRAMTPEQQRTHRFWIDGGIRDLFNFVLTGSYFAGHLQSVGQNVRVYDGFQRVFPDGAQSYFPNRMLNNVFAQSGDSVLVRYGDPDADAEAIDLGDGGHVGSPSQVLNRFISALDWVLNRWPDGDYTIIPPPLGREDRLIFFDAPRFGKRYRYGISLPPGYNLPENADLRYPVLLVLHGYGQTAADLPITGVLLSGIMAQGAWQKSIIVYPDGACGNSTRSQCNDGIDQDGDGLVDGYDPQRVACDDDEGCRGDYTCQASTAGGQYCCPKEWTDCGPPDPDCANRSRIEGEGFLARCEDGVDNDEDGLIDLDDDGCMGTSSWDSEADCKEGSFYTTHQARRDGEPGGPDHEGAILDMLDHLDANFRTRMPSEVMRTR